MAKGLFLVLEGIDNSGKTTQAALLKEYFEKLGREVIQTREPGGTKAGEEIRQVLLTDREKLLYPNTQLLLFYASRNEFLQEIIKPNLEAGKIVITDRFMPSSFSYQVEAQGADLELFDAVNQAVVLDSGLLPDLCVVIDITASESFARAKNSDNQGQDLIYEQQGLKFMEKIRQGYLKFAKIYKTKMNIKLINGMQSKDKIHQQILNLLKDA